LCLDGDRHRARLLVLAGQYSFVIIGELAANAAGDLLYQLHKDGTIWRYTGTPCCGSSCPGWQMLDNNPATTAIPAARAQLFHLHKDGTIWRYTGTPCSGSSCPDWQMLDNNPQTSAIAAADLLCQLHKDGTIWRYTGTPARADNSSTTIPGRRRSPSPAASCFSCTTTGRSGATPARPAAAAPAPAGRCSTTTGRLPLPRQGTSSSSCTVRHDLALHRHPL
jgi:hypothetical protein